jgi:hypothetical protein
VNSALYFPQSRLSVVYGLGRQIDDQGSPWMTEADKLEAENTGQGIALLKTTKDAKDS